SERPDAPAQRQLKQDVEQERGLAVPGNAGADDELPEIEFQDGVELRPADAKSLLCDRSPLRQFGQRIQSCWDRQAWKFDHFCHQITPGMPSSQFGSLSAFLPLIIAPMYSRGSDFVEACSMAARASGMLFCFAARSLLIRPPACLPSTSRPRLNSSTSGSGAASAASFFLGKGL